MIANTNPPPPPAAQAPFSWTSFMTAFVFGSLLVVIPFHFLMTYESTNSWEEDGVIYTEVTTRRVTTDKVLKTELQTSPADVQ